jgi:allantoin racemase
VSSEAAADRPSPAQRERGGGEGSARTAPRLLVINPNTTTAVTDLLARHVRAAAPPAFDITCVTAPFGVRYVSDETGFAVASHSTAVAFAREVQESGPPDGTLIGCFGDPGLFALRELSSQPVLGLAEAAMRAAARRGRFGIVTGGAAWEPMLARLIRALDLEAACAGIETVAATGAELAADPARAVRLLARHCDRLVARSGAQVVIIGGAGLAGMAAAIQPMVAVPLLDSVVAATAEIVAAIGQAPPAASAIVRRDLLDALLAGAPGQ